ncbi:glycosyltransferase [Devosia soli]|uniref:glycosyltransferase n=1 Tax=Devosia soli TaxID=361041 RepID=UPI001FCE0AC7|nr:glycosyltransferase [Devosia soli]
MNQRYLVFISEAAELCGVEAFTRLLAQHFGHRAKTHVLDGDLVALQKALADRDAVIFNFPIVGWKPKLFSPALAALATRVLGKDVVVFLHEWLALDWKRRIVLAPVVVLATRLCFSSPEIADEFSGTRLARFTTRKRQIVPIPPNIGSPAVPETTEHSLALAAQRRMGRFILAQFGSIYPKKQSDVVLKVAAHLIDEGHDVGVVFIGSFIKGQDRVEEDFEAAVHSLDLANRTTVTGYVDTDAELAAIFAEVDVFCYLFPEGLTARRGSVLAAALSGKPVVVNAPAYSAALDHHGLFQRLIAVGALRLVPANADVATVAQAVLDARQQGAEAFDAAAEIASLWTSILARMDAE